MSDDGRGRDFVAGAKIAATSPPMNDRRFT
jgi:hypothetical protein